MTQIADSVPARAGSGPLSLVLAAFTTGARSLPEIAAATDLSLDMVRSCVDHLVRSGRLIAKEMRAGCPGGGCFSCAFARPDGAACGLKPSEATPGLRAPAALIELMLPNSDAVGTGAAAA